MICKKHNYFLWNLRSHLCLCSVWGRGGCFIVQSREMSCHHFSDKMPIKIKITSKGEDISEYGPTGGGQQPSDLINSGDKTADSIDQTADSSDKTADSSDTSAESSEKTAEIDASSSSSENKSSEKDSKSLSADSTNAEDPMDTEPAGSQINYEYEGDDTFYTDAQTQGNYFYYSHFFLLFVIHLPPTIFSYYLMV